MGRSAGARVDFGAGAASAVGLGAGATSAQITGLAPGGRYQFLIEAYNSNSVADSAWVSVTTYSAVAQATTAAGKFSRMRLA